MLRTVSVAAMAKGQELVDALASTVQATTEICGDLTTEQWSRPTGCPGWSVQDTVAHLGGLEAAIVSGVEPDHELVGDFPHVDGPMAEYMERHVDARRGRPAADVLKEFTDVFADRIAYLRALPDAAYDEPAPGPMGSMNPLGRMLMIRVFDLWAHEQDIRRAVGKPGGTDSPAADVSLTTCKRSVGPVVAGVVPDGATVVLHLDGAFGGDFAWSFDNGQATALDAPPPQPTVSLTTDTETFAVLCCGRSDARPHDVKVVGDAALGATVLANLGFTP
ncbi:MAG: hypothetical protein QOI61_1906 [Actinomycetota bacterium]